jgi:hypothetical protein
MKQTLEWGLLGTIKAARSLARSVPESLSPHYCRTQSAHDFSRPTPSSPGKLLPPAPCSTTGLPPTYYCLPGRHTVPSMGHSMSARTLSILIIMCAWCLMDELLRLWCHVSAAAAAAARGHDASADEHANRQSAPPVSTRRHSATCVVGGGMSR